MKKRRLAILGSTGSIGTQACEVAMLHQDRFEVVALTAYSSREKLFEHLKSFFIYLNVVRDRLVDPLYAESASRLGVVGNYAKTYKRAVSRAYRACVAGGGGNANGDIHNIREHLHPRI